MKPTTSEFYIINHTDKPCGRLVTQLVNGKLWYMNPELIKSYPAMNLNDESTSLEDFGFEFRHLGKYVQFIKNGKTVATYKDGKPRSWQGETEFIQPYITKTPRVRKRP